VVLYEQVVARSLGRSVEMQYFLSLSATTFAASVPATEQQIRERAPHSKSSRMSEAGKESSGSSIVALRVPLDDENESSERTILG